MVQVAAATGEPEPEDADADPFLDFIRPRVKEVPRGLEKWCKRVGMGEGAVESWGVIHVCTPI